MNQNIIKKTDYPHTIKPLKIHFSKQFKKLTSQCEYEPNNVPGTELKSISGLQLDTFSFI